MAVPSNQGGLSPLADAVVRLVRLGAKGDRKSVQAFARRLLTRPPEVGDVLAFREALGAALAEAGQVPSFLRASSPIAPADEESALSLGEVEILPQHATAPILEPTSQTSIETLIAERRGAARLLAAGLEPPSRALLLGPPGVGKSMTARYLAAALGLPLVTIDLAAVVSSYLGKTGHNLRRVFDYARSYECVLLADEFDALAKRRDDEGDVGELKRLVNLLLMELDRWPSSTLFVAASNHPELLDSAVERRFDVVVRLERPTRQTRARLFQLVASESSLVLSAEAAELCALATERLTGSDIRRLAESAFRDAVLSEQPPEAVLLHRVVANLTNGGLTARDDRARFAALAIAELGLSRRHVAQLLGVTHPTVSKWMVVGTTAKEGSIG